MNSRTDGLNLFVGTNTLIRVDRKPLDPDFLGGFPVGLGSKFLLLHALDLNAYLNGYIAVRTRDVAGWKPIGDADSVMGRALRLRGLGPVPRPEITLDDLGKLLTSVNEQYPLLTIHCEQRWPDSCWIGRVDKMMSRAVELKKIDLAARWIEVERFYFRDVTRVDFGGGYEDALARVAAHETLAGPIQPETWN